MQHTTRYDRSERTGWVFRHRSALLVLVLAPSALLEERLAAPLGPLLDVAAVLALVLGVALRLWAVRRLGKRARVHSPRADALRTDGPYALTRNPIYVANGLVAIGFTVLACPWPYAPVAFLLLCAIYHMVVTAEERFLTQAFGADYEAYCRAVPRWIPRIGVRAPRSDEPRVAWREVFRREGAAVLGVGIALGVVALRRRYYDPGLAWEWGLSLGIGLLACLITVAFTHQKANRHEARRRNKDDSVDLITT